jgi:hypothetical protein
MKTPIYIDYKKRFPNHLITNELNIHEQDPVDIYVNPLILNPLDTTHSQPYLLAPRYYLHIQYPQNQPGPSIKIPLHKSPNSLLDNKIRIILKPSVGWGINASYKVDIWEWIPNINLPAIPSKKKILTEYWYVPTLDREYTPHHPFDIKLNEWYPKTAMEFLYKSRRTSIVLEVERTVVGNTVEDLITDINGSNVFCFPEDSYISFSENVIQENLEFNNETKTWTFSKALLSSKLVRDSSKVDGALINGIVQTTIEYIEPLHPEQLIFIDHNDILNDGLTSTPYFI